VTEEALFHAVDALVNSMKRTMEASPREPGLHAAIAEYLSIRCRDDATGGCVFAALGGDIARSTDAVRDAATAGFLKMAGIISCRLTDVAPETARNEAFLMLSTMIGAVTMARVVTDPVISDCILELARARLT
jgi:TetR/AcrR family transcriptional regulator, transcriptional repressor for nem operon